MIKKFLLWAGFIFLASLISVYFNLFENFLVANQTQHGGHGGGHGGQVQQAEQSKDTDQSKYVTLTGEVVDLQCLLGNPDMGKGPSHDKCARMCIKKGLPIGFVMDGQIYLLIGKEHDSIKDDVLDYAGKISEITGIFIEYKGIKAIQVKNIKNV